MPGAGTLVLSGIITGLPTGDRTVNVALPLDAAIDDSVQMTLIAGDNLFLIPAGASMVMIEQSASNTVVVRLKNPGDSVGVSLHRTLPLVWAFDVSQTSFSLNAASNLAGPTQLTFF